MYVILNIKTNTRVKPNLSYRTIKAAKAEIDYYLENSEEIVNRQSANINQQRGYVSNYQKQYDDVRNNIQALSHLPYKDVCAEIDILSNRQQMLFELVKERKGILKDLEVNQRNNIKHYNLVLNHYKVAELSFTPVKD